jgi:hypothetical protein
MHGNSLWNLVLVASILVLLVVVAAIGIACAFNPQWGIRHFSRRLTGGGELRRDWNQLNMSLAGVALAAVAIYMLYHLFWK